MQIILSCWVSASPHQFIGVFGPGQVADLRARVGALQRLTRQRVPEAKAAVGGAAPRRQQPVLVRRPGDRLHRRQVVAVLLHWEEAGAVPHQQLWGSRVVKTLSPMLGGWGWGGFEWHHLVVVASGRQVLVVR